MSPQLRLLGTIAWFAVLVILVAAWVSGCTPIAANAVPQDTPTRCVAAPHSYRATPDGGRFYLDCVNAS